MYDFSYMFSDAMERATAMIAYCMFAALIEKILEAERKQMKAVLGHEPTQEESQYYYELQLEKMNRQNAHQREADRKKLRRLVFGEEDSDSKASQ
jgi:hypothetical protein